MRRNLFAFFVPLLSCSSASSLSFGLAGGESSVRLDVGSTLSLFLEAKPGSTGFDWHLSAAPSCLQASQPKHVSMDAGKRSLPGGSIQSNITFKAVDVCESRVELRYYREWEGVQDTSPTILIHVSVIGNNEGL